ncbi:MAG: MFS transporter [Bryobacterales bacterium]|nr:MFS transporter [Bryobacterales bacterium]
MRLRGYYPGWWNLGVAALAMVATLPGRTQGLGLVTEPLLRDFGLDRVAYATVNLWATLLGSLLCLPVGGWVDRWGARVVLTTVLAALGATVLGMSGGTGLITLYAGILLTRALGQSALSVVSLALVGKWFSKRLNIAMGVYSLLVGMGFVTAFPLVGQAVLGSGWRMAWTYVGWGVLAMAPLAWMVARSNPEAAGVTGGQTVEVESSDSDLGLRDALRGGAFWIFALSSAVFGLVYSGISLFNESILQQRGFDAKVYHTVLVVSTLLGLVANFAGGWLASRWSIRRLMGIGMAVLAAALVSLPLVRTYAHVMAYGAAMGIAGGVVTVVFFSVWGQVYGRRELGRIQGCAQMMTVFASAVGPLLLAETLERTGSYDGMFYGLAVVTTVLGLLCWHAPMPARRVALAEACR